MEAKWREGEDIHEFHSDILTRPDSRDYKTHSVSRASISKLSVPLFVNMEEGPTNQGGFAHCNSPQRTTTTNYILSSSSCLSVSSDPITTISPSQHDPCIRL